ncbi:helix-turn-helix domain-containing protein [Phytohabitans kaempferiae]|uniref:Helix-turn-helix domain-containing protein n=1 Tax=Phytohabitans kaempferiae TaxID=1620943 RepID=A0ABV6MF13_9ACTN
MSSSIHQAREALGSRLRDLRKDAGLTGMQLALLAGWHSSKVSKIEYGKQAPSEDDIRVWARHCEAPDQVPDLLATVRNIEAMYVEWRRMLNTGTRRRQEASIALEAETKLFRWYEPVLVPGILHTAEYAAAVLSRVIDFYGIPDDLEAGVAARMERQQILYRGDHRFHFILAEQALHTIVGDTNVMIGQLDRLITILSMPRVSLGILPARHTYQVPTNQFILFDERLVHVEAISAEIAVTQPREIALYAKAFRDLSQAAVHGRTARDLIAGELATLNPT